MNDYNVVLARNTTNAPKGIGPYSQTVDFSHYNQYNNYHPKGALVRGR